MERFAGGNPGHLPSEPGAAQGTHCGGVRGTGCDLQRQDSERLETDAFASSYNISPLMVAILWPVPTNHQSIFEIIFVEFSHMLLHRGVRAELVGCFYLTPTALRIGDAEHRAARVIALQFDSLVTPTLTMTPSFSLSCWSTQQTQGWQLKAVRTFELHSWHDNVWIIAQLYCGVYLKKDMESCDLYWSKLMRMTTWQVRHAFFHISATETVSHL